MAEFVQKVCPEEFVPPSQVLGRDPREVEEGRAALLDMLMALKKFGC